jgi:4-hydroxy-3-methylbut-2-enyl diphosphate reductase
MKIFLAEYAGFCFGVKRAINLAIETAKNTKGKVYTYGPIIHNQEVVSKFEKQGIISVDDISKIEEGSSIIIRTHGVSPDKIQEFKKRNFNIIDATCPFVKKAQKFVEQLVNEGYQVVIIGESDHPEVKGICGFAGNNAIVVKDVEEVEKIPKFQKIGVVVQTTQSMENFKNVVSCLLEKALEFKIFNTICDATKKRQDSILKLAKEVDIMIILGGYNSANTKHLAEICSSVGVEVYHIENSAELKEVWFKGKDKVGVAAGASTPDWIINEVVECLKKF